MSKEENGLVYGRDGSVQQPNGSSLAGMLGGHGECAVMNGTNTSVLRQCVCFVDCNWGTMVYSQDKNGKSTAEPSVWTDVHQSPMAPF